MRVFISSTCFDLLDVRAELEAHLRDVGLSPVLSDRPTSDFLVSPDANSIETCLANVRGSDAVICVLCQRYGPSLASAGFEDVSATELEWREARKAQKPVYMYVRDRLESEYAIWSRNPELKTAWVKDLRLFTFLKEHRRLVASQSASNWFSIFSNSVDLKAQVGRDFRAFSGREVLRRWLAEGRLPLLRVTASDLSPGSNESRLGKLVITAGRSGPALEVLLRLDAEPQGRRLGDIRADTSITTNARIPSDADEMRVTVQYVTDFGATIEDEFLIRCAHLSEGQVSGTLTRKSLLREISDVLDSPQRVASR